MQQRLPSLLDTPIAFGHRGARAHQRENTLTSFQLALKLGANGLESDVWMTADDVPVLDHDGLVKRRFGRARPIAAVRRADLPDHIPSLAELYDTAGTGFQLSLDLKDPNAAPAVIRVAREAGGGAVERLWLCGTTWESLVDQRGLGAKLVESTTLRRIPEGFERRAATLQAEGIDAINMHFSEWTGGLVTLAHRFHRLAFGWGMQEPHVLETGFRMGLDGVYSDWVDRMMDAYRAEVGSPS